MWLIQALIPISAPSVLFITVWNPTVSSAPDSPPAGELELVNGPPPAPAANPSSGTIAKPETISCTDDVSSPLLTMSSDDNPSGEYTSSDPDASAQLSCSMSKLDVDFNLCNHRHIQCALIAYVTIQRCETKVELTLRIDIEFPEFDPFMK